MKARSLLGRFTALRAAVSERVRKVNAMTERGTLEAGAHLQHVVGVARSHIAQLRDLLVGAARSTTIANHAEHIRRVGAALDLAVVAHVGEVQSVVEIAQQIKTAARDIERANAAARLLAINARIESGRSGAEVFKTIAIEMSELARSVANANSRIQELAHRIEVTLPRLVEQSQALRRMVAEFMTDARAQIDRIDGEVDALRTSVEHALVTSDEALETIIAASHGGLSALGFQDVCAQSLLQLDAWHADALRDTAAELGVGLQVPPATETVSTETGILDHERAGEVLLF
jgi:hypothetical protein